MVKSVLQGRMIFKPFLLLWKDTLCGFRVVAQAEFCFFAKYELGAK
jgi:hypothetical protein